jgi:hypothetical protein
LLTALSIERKAAKHLPTIKITAGEMNRIVDGAEKELSLTGQHYQRGTIIVTVVTDPQIRATNVKHLTLPSLTRVVSTLAIWERFDKREMRWLTADPPEKHVKILHDATHYPHLPVLNGIARQPYLRPDGSICKTAGYDPVTGLFGVFNAKLFDIPDKPTRDHAEIALQKLTALLCEFCFKSDHDLSAALSGLLAASIRISLALCPMYHAAAPASGSGKGYLCELITLFCTP